MILCYLYELENGIKTVRFYWMKRNEREQANERTREEEEEGDDGGGERKKRRKNQFLCLYAIYFFCSYRHHFIYSEISKGLKSSDFL